MNIAATPYRVNRSRWLLIALIVVSAALKLWLTLGVELGKDEAAYWYWSLHWDLAYSPLPFAFFRLAHALAPGVEWALRACQIAAGMIAIGLMFRWCRSSKLGAADCLWATAAFATSHWIWHSSSFLHPDGFLVPTWLLVLVLARRSAARGWPPVASMGVGVSAAMTVYCKYSGMPLAASVFIWIWLAGAPTTIRKQALSYSLLAFAVVLAPLALTHWADGFHLPQALSSLSRIADSTSVFARGGLFLVAPLLFVSPLLLWVLYRAFGSTFAAAGSKLSRAATGTRSAWMRSHDPLVLALAPAATVLLCFGFFALYRGQIKGSWILPAFLALWPYAFGATTGLSSRTRMRGRRFLILVILVGLLQSLTASLALKYPGAVDSFIDKIGGQKLVDESYPALVSPADRAREPTRSWNERLCEYAGWSAFTRNLEQSMTSAGLSLSVALVSSQYNLPFTTAFYAAPGTERRVYTVADARFMHLADLNIAQPRPDTLLFVARAGSPLPAELEDYSTASRLPRLDRMATGCGAVAYELTLLTRRDVDDE